jgi:pimeloyl-ACP methyl ester carboxylesterase
MTRVSDPSCSGRDLIGAEMFAEHQLTESAPALNLAVGAANGPPLLFLHGISRRWQDFIPFANAFAAQSHIAALDLRGHGRSGRVAGRYRVVDYVADILRVLDSLEAPTVIYGHSLGALVAGAAAAARPQLCRGLVLEDPVGGTFLDRLDDTPYPALFAAMLRLAAGKLSVGRIAEELADVRIPMPDRHGEVRLGDVRDAESIRFSAESLVDLDPDVLAPVLNRSWLDGFDAAAIWSGVRCPTLLLRADPSRGGLLPKPDADAMTSRMARCVTVDFPGVDHLIHRSAMPKTQQLVREFLESLDKP